MKLSILLEKLLNEKNSLVHSFYYAAVPHSDVIKVTKDGIQVPENRVGIAISRNQNRMRDYASAEARRMGNPSMALIRISPSVLEKKHFGDKRSDIKIYKAPIPASAIRGVAVAV